MQTLLGPNVIAHGLDPETAIVCYGSDDNTAYLGPSTGLSDEMDKIANFFVVLGKLISVRRVGTQDKLAEPNPPAAIETFGALQAFALDQKDDGSAFELVWRPLAQQIEQAAVKPLERQTVDVDQRTRRFIAAETHVILALDPRASVEHRMASLNEYLLHNGYTVEAGSDGFRDFIAKAFVDHRGNRVNLPTSTNPSFPDSWITPTKVDPQAHGGSRREWSIIL